MPSLDEHDALGVLIRLIFTAPDANQASSRVSRCRPPSSSRDCLRLSWPPRRPRTTSWPPCALPAEHLPKPEPSHESAGALQRRDRQTHRRRRHLPRRARTARSAWSRCFLSSGWTAMAALPRRISQSRCAAPFAPKTETTIPSHQTTITRRPASSLQPEPPQRLHTDEKEGVLRLYTTSLGT